MRLIALSANEASFKKMQFNRTGISLIVAQKENNKISHDDRSCNGVGKSLIVEIIHFCLGSQANEAFKKYLPNWEFYLEFEINEASFLSTRNASNQDTIYLNDKPYKQKEFGNLLEKLTFQIPEDSQYLTFRSLYPRFMRRYLEDYNDPQKTSSDRSDYACLVRNLFLLGVNIDLAYNKYTIQCEKLKLEAMKKSFKKDDYIKNFYAGNKDVALQIAHLEDKIKSLDLNLSNFQVANDYYEIEQAVDKLNEEMAKTKNKKVIVENSLDNINKSLQIKNDISKEKILILYKELLSVFKNESLKKMEDIENFNFELIKNRINRLNQEKMKLLSQLEKLDCLIKKQILDFDEKLSYLSNKRALDQYSAVNNQRSEFQGKLQKIKDYQLLTEKIDADLLDIGKKLAEESIKTQQYLRDTEEEREKKFQLFSQLVKEVYPTAPAGISLKNNTGEKNKIRYSLDVRVESDSSDGINSAKIFCYDLSILLMNCNHNIDFIWHDSRLFSDIDPRQRAVLFKLAYKSSTAADKQYIATVNQHELDAMQCEFTDEEYQVIFDNSIVLTLKDDKPEGKLLGKKIDMHYHSKKS